MSKKRNPWILLGLAYLGIAVVCLGGYGVMRWMAADYFAADRAREDWHYRCDQYRYTKPTDPHAAQAAACQQEAEALVMEAKRKGYLRQALPLQ